jgi:radical SAM protein with 4Fe4S-binding SPASM domain
VNLTRIGYGLKELTFVRSPGDVRIVYDKSGIWIRAILRYQGFLKVPPVIQLEPTNKCILNCIMCPQSALKRGRGYMDYGLFQKIIDDAAGIGVKRIWLYMQGEPLLHPDIVDMVRYIKKKGMGIDLTTNGMLLDRNKAVALLDAGMDSADYITFSLMGNSKEVHEAIMRGVNHERVEQNLLGLLDLRRQRKMNGPIIQTDFYMIPENQHEAAAYEEHWKGKVDHVLPVRLISVFFSRHGDMSQIMRKPVSCTQAWERMTVFWNGDVTVCNEDVDGAHVFDNLQSHTIRELWNDGNFVQFKKLVKRRRFESLLCAHCDAYAFTYWLSHESRKDTAS